MQSTQLDIMIFDRYQIHSYKYVIGLIDVYSRYVVCRALTNMKISTILSNLKEMCEELSKKAGSLRTAEGYKETHYPENMNTHQQFDKPALTNFMTEKGTHFWFSQETNLTQECDNRTFLEDSCASSTKNERGNEKF